MNKNKRHIYLTRNVAALFLSFSLNVYAQADASASKERPLFNEDSTLAVTIEGPLQTIMRNRDDPKEAPGKLSYTDSDGTLHTLDMNLRMRGKFRAKRDICNFTPLRVNFKKSQVKGTLFAGQDKIKLVTDCQSGKSRHQQLVLKEYLAYKILNLISDRSFSARLLRITYVDTDRKGKSRESYGFFIEDQDHIADRLGLKRAKMPRTKYGALQAAQANLVTVYEYFIANTDFSMVAGPPDSNCCHNTVLYQNNDEPLIAIPYDFDHAGLIDAPYASPNPRFRLKTVTQRLYRGQCANNELLDSTFQRFTAKRDDINELIKNLEGFSTKSNARTMSLVDDFYKDISTPKKIEKKFFKKCS